MPDISGSVGQGGDNNHADVLVVQQLLNKLVASLGLERLKEDGLFGIETVGAIRRYQADVIEMSRPDGRIDVGGKTWRALAAGKVPAAKPKASASAPAAAAAPQPAPRGKARWTWDQSAGTLAWDGKVVAHGYAGKGTGKNNPAMDGVKKTGPIPRGVWRMTAMKASKNTGPGTIVLIPEPGTDTKGRSEFRVHGDNKTGTASEGCIILPRSVRDLIWDRRDKSPLIEVIE